jgi:hypothetical protein
VYGRIAAHRDAITGTFNGVVVATIAF